MRKYIISLYVDWLQQLDKKGGSIYKLSDSEIKYLTTYVETHTGRGKVFANNILCFLYRICPEEAEEVRGLRFEVGGEGEAESRRQNAESDDNLTVLPSYGLTVFENISLVPNPTTGKLRIENGELKIENVEVFDIYGRNQSNVSRVTRNEIIDISDLSAGIYFVKITTEAGEITRKIIKI